MCVCVCVCMYMCPCLLNRQPSMYLSLPPTRQDLTQGQKPEGRLIEPLA